MSAKLRLRLLFDCLSFPGCFLFGYLTHIVKNLGDTYDIFIFKFGAGSCTVVAVVFYLWILEILLRQQRKEATTLKELLPDLSRLSDGVFVVLGFWGGLYFGGR